MSDHDDGGPAFPCMPPQDTAAGAATGYPYPDAGMTLRDYFAGKALEGVPQPLDSLHEIEAGYMRIATHCYRMADAMLKARQPR